MCCEICARYVSCEEEGHLGNECCISCIEYSACHGKAGSRAKESDGLEEEFDEM